MLQNTKKGRHKIEKDLVSLMCLEVKYKKQRTTNLFGHQNAASNLRVRCLLETEIKTVTIG